MEIRSRKLVECVSNDKGKWKGKADKVNFLVTREANFVEKDTYPLCPHNQ